MTGLLRKFRSKCAAAYKGYVVNGVLAPRVFEAHLRFWAKIVLRAKRPKIVGITGSVGKSTTTAMICGALNQPDAVAVLGRVVCTAGNMNNWDGVPLVVLGFRRWYKTPLEMLGVMVRLPFRTLRLCLSPDFPRVLVLEFGSDRSGYLKPLVDFAPPHIAIITAIGPAHLQGMGSMEGIVHEKATLLRGVPAPELVILGEDHEHIDALQRYTNSPVVRVGGRGAELATRIARIVCEALGVPPAVVESARCEEVPARRLQEVRRGSSRIIDDSYNASPLSMQLGLDTLSSTTPPGARRVAILGLMAELGAYAPKYHKEIGQYARSHSDYLVGVGELATHYEADRWFCDSNACADAIEEIVQRGDHILVKGSASANMGVVVERLSLFL